MRLVAVPRFLGKMDSSLETAYRLVCADHKTNIGTLSGLILWCFAVFKILQMERIIVLLEHM